MRVRPVTPRARRIADIVASVPELTMRTTSIDGTRRVIVSAIVTSASHGVPNDRPFSMAFATAARTCGWLWPTTIGPHEPT
jgi:hypothetical protein